MIQLKNVKNQLTRYIENENSNLIKQQPGLRRNHSCKMSLYVVLKQWKEEIDKNNIIVAVFLDLKRAFETIDRNTLMQKLFCYGITENTYDWFKSYCNTSFNLLDCIEKIYEDLASLSKWLKFNKLNLKVYKTKYMGLSRRRVDVGAHEALSIYNEQLEEVNSIKYFRVQIDNKLNFKKHLAMIVKKLQRK
jgi:hypothetical protein